ncbi:MAG: hypothetical protein KDJ80_12605 [Nitratireductor sp.]|nr:hypothetical protein [Nitratireductor sp.]
MRLPIRLLTLFLALLLVACATPKTAPLDFYSGTYAPGQVTIGDDDTYAATGAVFSLKDEPIAWKAAYARLMLRAKEAGYGYFAPGEEQRQVLIGVKVTLNGRLMRSAASTDDVYPIDAIKRMLQGLPVRTLKEIAEAAARKRPAAKAVPGFRTAPASRSAPPAAASTGEPLVIMAPEDITGSIRPAGQAARQVDAQPSRAPSAVPVAPAPQYRLPDNRPASLRLIPSGVILQSGIY